MIYFREAREEDTDAIAAICRDAKGFYDFAEEGFERMAQAFETEGLYVNYNLRMVYDEDELVGFIGTHDLGNHRCMLVALYIRNAMQRKGYGKLIIDVLGKEDDIYLYTHEKAHWAIGFYEKIGFNKRELSDEDIHKIHPRLLTDRMPNTILYSKDKKE